MKMLNPWKFGLVTSLTVLVNYAICTIFWYAFNNAAVDFINGLFHGADFGKIYRATPFSVTTFLYVLMVFAVWAYFLGVIYALMRNLFFTDRQ